MKRATLAATLRRQWKRYRHALEHCQKHFTEKAVHDSRVESRRLMAQLELLGIFSPPRLFKRARRVLKQHLDSFEVLRDTQVQLLLLRTAASEPGMRGVVVAPPAKPRPMRKASRQGTLAKDSTPARPLPLLRTTLLEREKRCLEHAARDIRHVKVGRLKKAVSTLIQHLEDTEGDSGRQLRDHRAILRAVDQAHARVAERRNRMDPGHVATIHRTRVAFKKFRYMVEALQPLLPEVTRERLAAMHSLQTLFGELQDTDVFLTWLDKLLVKNPAQAAPLAVFRHWLLARRATQIQLCMDSSDEIQKFWPLPKTEFGPARAASPRHRHLL